MRDKYVKEPQVVRFGLPADVYESLGVVVFGSQSFTLANCNIDPLAWELIHYDVF